MSPWPGVRLCSNVRGDGGVASAVAATRLDEK